jgi:hypothetical protein
VENINVQYNIFDIIKSERDINSLDPPKAELFFVLQVSCAIALHKIEAFLNLEWRINGLLNCYLHRKTENERDRRMRIASFEYGQLGAETHENVKKARISSSSPFPPNCKTIAL